MFRPLVAFGLYLVALMLLVSNAGDHKDRPYKPRVRT